MKAPKDKRTKEYKDWKKEFDDKNSTGLGDVIEKVTATTGIKKVVKAFNKDCGCDERKEKLNKIRFRFPVVRCFTEQQYNQWASIRNKSLWTREDQTEVLIPIYAHLFARQLKPMNCCLEPFINEIDKVFKNE